MNCRCCGRDIDAIGQNNVSAIPGYPMCEDCGQVHDDSDFYYHGEDENNNGGNE
jgi:hypothetical protein